VPELLSWHGQSGGGVHVPFGARVNPLGAVIQTPLVRRLRGLAREIALDANSHPRWIFLVGGPGNGKSETVENFLTSLDDQLGMNGALCNVLRQRFASEKLPRKVEILPVDLGPAEAQFAARVRRLVVVQDATATETALGNAANELAWDLADLLTSSNDPPLPVFVACANRGLLARAMNEAFREFDESVTSLLRNVIRASSLGRETLGGRKSCWPLETDQRVACWPLDVESLLLENGDVSGKVVSMAHLFCPHDTFKVATRQRLEWSTLFLKFDIFRWRADFRREVKCLSIKTIKCPELGLADARGIL
jgi:hypothetical protein